MLSPFFKKSAHDGRDRVARGALLLDVRTSLEFSEGHLSGAINIPLQQLTERARQLQSGCEIVVYCRSGARSAAATQILRGLGHDVLDVGPMSAY